MLRKMRFDATGALIEHTLDGVPQPLVQPTLTPRLTTDDWPLWAKALKHLAIHEDKGIGDVLARTIGPENSDAFKTWFRKTFNKDCGCDGRQAQWNRLYPL